MARVYTTQRVTVVAMSAIGLPLAAVLMSTEGPEFTLAIAGLAVLLTAGLTLLHTRRSSTGEDDAADRDPALLTIGRTD